MWRQLRHSKAPPKFLKLGASQALGEDIRRVLFSTDILKLELPSHETVLHKIMDNFNVLGVLGILGVDDRM